MNTALDSKQYRVFLEDFPAQVREAIKLGQQIRINDPISRIVIAGTGTSAIAADMVRALARYDKIPITTIKNYALPQWVTDTTLVFILSHSGDDTQATSIYAEAIRKKAQIVIITAGGKLRFVARDHSTKVLTIPKGMPERTTLAYQAFPVLQILESSGFTKALVRDIPPILNALQNTNYAAKAQALATKLKFHTPVIVAGPRLAPAARRWAQMCALTAKTHAITIELPNDLHKINGFEELFTKYHILLLRDDRDHKDTQKQFDYMKQLAKEKGVGITELALKGQSQVNKLMSAVYLGDWSMYFLALLQDKDPTPTPIIDAYHKS